MNMGKMMHNNKMQGNEGVSSINIGELKGIPSFLNWNLFAILFFVVVCALLAFY